MAKCGAARGKNSGGKPSGGGKKPTNVGLGPSKGKKPMPFGKKVNTGIQVGD